MAYRPQRQKRYMYLREKGFLPFEAQTLSVVPKSTPYLRAMVSQRAREQSQAIKSGKSRAQYERGVKERYTDKKWTRNGKADPWRMLRDSEDRYKSKHPEYTSPFKKRRRDFQEAVRKFENTFDPFRKQQEKILKKMGI